MLKAINIKWKTDGDKEVIKHNGKEAALEYARNGKLR